MMHDIIVAILVLSGGIFCFAAGMGVLHCDPFGRPTLAAFV